MMHLLLKDSLYSKMEKLWQTLSTLIPIQTEEKYCQIVETKNV